MTDNSTTSFTDMLAVLQRNPLKAIQLAGKAHRGVNRRSWEIAGIACGVARILKDDDKHRDDFYDEEFFENLKRLNSDKLLLHVFAYLYGSLDGPAYNRASEHARALKKVCDDRDIEVADIPEYIADHGGFDGLLKEREDQEDNQANNQPDDQEADSGGVSSKHGGGTPRVALRPATQGPTLTSDDDGLHDDDLVPGANEDDERVAPPRRKAPKQESAEPKLTLLPREYLAGCVAIHFGPEDMAKVMKAYLDGNDVLIKSSPGKISTSHELYAGAGPFLEICGTEHDAP